MANPSRLPALDAGATVLHALLDPDQGEFPEADLADPKRCPVSAYARMLVRSALDSDPGLLAAARAPSSITIIEVPSADLIDPVGEAWRAEVMASDAVPDCGDDTGAAVGPWLEFRRESGARPSKLDTSRVAEALAAGKPVFAFSDAPNRVFPDDLLRAADRRLILQPLNGPSLVAALMLHHGAPITRIPDDGDARLVRPGDLLLARRPDADPDEHLRRALALASGRNAATGSAVLLEDLHGMDQAVRWGLDLREDLAAFAAGQIGWSEVDRGALLAGPTGTGKTTFARALAATCGVPLIIGSLAAWQASGTGHLGDMLKAMRTTFDEARRAAPCILFLDEVDGIGNRATFGREHRAYFVQVLNALLELLDGIQSREGVVVVAATNRLEAIDPALLRPGRLDRVIEIQLPDANALAGILRHHLGGDLAEVDTRWLAHAASGASGAHVERWVRGMRRRARKARRPPTAKDLEAEMTDGHLPVSTGVRHRICIHEGGHAVVIGRNRPGALASVSVPRSSNAQGPMGVVASRDSPLGLNGDRHVTRSVIVSAIAERLAGRVAEWLLLGDVSAGAGGRESSDLAEATWIATAAVASFGLGMPGNHAPLWRGLPTIEEVPSLLAADPGLVDQVARLMAEGHAEAASVLEDNQAALERIASLLLERSTLSGSEVEALLAGPEGNAP
ncbi:MAG: AAA family ATPase [Acetobacteraceae bacterium]|nr:AAA family ATPase [Acetobacteraceae bacterium]